MTVYLTELAEQLGVDTGEAVKAMLEINRRKFPTGLLKGPVPKYTEYQKCPRSLSLRLGTPKLGGT